MAARRLEVITNSSMSTLRACDEKFRLGYLERLEPRAEQVPFQMGSAVHDGIEHRDPDRAIAYVNKHAGAIWPGDGARLREVAIRAGVCGVMTEGALRTWTVWPDLQEESFVIPLRNPATGGTSTTHKLGGKKDGLWTADDPHPDYPGEDVLLEVKTTGRLDGDYMARLLIAMQPTVYMLAASVALGRPVRRAIYRIIKKPGIRPRKGETDSEYAQRVADRAPLKPLKQRATETDDAYAERSAAREANRKPLQRKVTEPVDDYVERFRADTVDRPETYFAEVVVTRTDADIERLEYELWESHKRILHLERGGMSLRNDGSCLDYGRCTYFDLCTGQVGVEAFRVRDVAHPELED